MIYKPIFVVSIALLGLLVSSCVNPGKGPSNYVFEYYEALKASDYDKAYSYLSDENKKAISKQVYIDYHFSDPYKEAIFKLTEYKLESEEMSNNRAEVIIIAKGPDIPTTILLAKLASHMAVLNQEGIDELNRFIREQFNDLVKSGEATFKSHKITLNLVMENNDWKLAQ